MHNIAVILAGGIGSRVGGETPKQLLPLADGRSILEHSIDAFEASPSIDEIAVVMHPEWLKEAETICRRNTWHKLTKIIPGGAERWESSYNAIKTFTSSSSLHGEAECGMLLHDAARPFVSQRIIADVCQALEIHEAVTVAVPVTDTLYRTEDNQVQEIPDRKAFMRAQTPQAFHLSTIAEAFQKMVASISLPLSSPLHRGTERGIPTDDVAVLKSYSPGTPIFIVPGEETNKKITYPEDIK